MREYRGVPEPSQPDDSLKRPAPQSPDAQGYEYQNEDLDNLIEQQDDYHQEQPQKKKGKYY